LSSLAHQPAGETKPLPRSIKFEVEVARTGRSSMNEMDEFGRRSVLACPDCGGVMWELDEGDMSRFRCHVGHTYTAELMSLALDDNLRRALASAIRALEERAALAHKLYSQARSAGHRLLAENWAARLTEFEREMDVIRTSTRRMDQLAAEADLNRQRAAE
jgi:two-component system, chemotaxis family, protein-glutamate methylesterase/glutaminase